MKKLLLIGLTLFSVNALANGTDIKVRPDGDSEYVTQGRIVRTELDEKVDVYTDTKTGCQYIMLNRDGYGRASEKLGCFDEYKKK